MTNDLNDHFSKQLIINVMAISIVVSIKSIIFA